MPLPMALPAAAEGTPTVLTINHIFAAIGALTSAIVTMAGTVWWFIRRIDRARTAADKERAVVTSATLKYLQDALETQKVTAESISKLATSVNTQTEVLRSHHEQMAEQHSHICLFLQKGKLVG